MPIDFHDPHNRRTYAGRDADEGWGRAMLDLVAPAGGDVVDVGCGAGVYARAWSDLGAATVTGVDFSDEMLAAAREDAGGRPELRFVHGTADATGLPSGCADIVFARALVHHLSDAGAFVAEARRLLRPGGTLVVQDRTLDDVGQPGSPAHPRGLILERFPQLLEIEAGRRPVAARLEGLLRSAGLEDVRARQLWELRRTYPTPEPYLEEIRLRTGRSLLHDLDDGEVAALVDHLASELPPDRPVEERDRWTLWWGRAPDVARSLG